MAFAFSCSADEPLPSPRHASRNMNPITVVCFSTCQTKLSIQMKLWIVFCGLLLAISGAKGQNSTGISFVNDNWKAVQCFAGKFVLKKIGGEGLKENFSAVYSWREDINAHFVTHLTIYRYGEKSFDIDESFDGKDYTLIDKTGYNSLCKVSKRLPEDVKTFELGMTPLEPFRFLTKEGARTISAHPTLSEVADELRAEISKQNLPLNGQETSFASKEALTFDAITNQSTRYQVFLDKGTHQLLGWRFFNAQKRLDTELQVDGWTTCNTSSIPLRYPSAYRLRYYSQDQSTQAPELDYEYSGALDITEVLDQSNIPDSTIDPAEADYIYDLDKKVLIRVPR